MTDEKMKRFVIRASKAVLPPKLRTKLLLAAAELKSLIKYGERHYFQQVWIETVTHCNRRCSYCTNSVLPIAAETMAPNRFVKILERLKDIGWDGPLGYHYLGEPLLHPEILRLVELTRSVLPRALPILFTNGDRLSLELAYRLQAAGLFKAAITRHRPYRDEWDDRIEQVQAIDPFLFEVFNIEDKSNELVNMAGILSGITTPMRERCMAPKRTLPIRMNGDVSLCCCDYKQEVTFGNVLETPIQELWDAARWKGHRELLMHGIRTFEICKGCTGVA